MADVIQLAAAHPAGDASPILPEEVRENLAHLASALDYADRRFGPGVDKAQRQLDEAVSRLDRALLVPETLDFDRFVALFGCRPNLVPGYVILSSVERVTGAKPRASVQRLMAEWLTDPIWDVYETEGFEAYADELRAFQAQHEAKWQEEAAARAAARRRHLEVRAGALGCSVELVEHIERLEARIENLEERLTRQELM